MVEPSLATSNFLKNESVWGVCWEIMTVACKMGFRGTVLCILADGCTCWNAIGIDASKMKCNVYRCITTFQAFQTDWRYKILLFWFLSSRKGSRCSKHVSLDCWVKICLFIEYLISSLKIRRLKMLWIKKNACCLFCKHLRTFKSNKNMD